MHYNHILVGQGIAGSVLALSLNKQEKNILVIDKPELSSCSKVAAGVWNPIVFKRLTKSWMADEVLPAAEEFYPWAEEILGCKFYHKMPMVKFFTEQQEVYLWQKKSSQAESKYLSKTIEKKFHPNELHQGLACSQVEHAGYLDVMTFLNATRKFLKEKNLLLETIFDHSQLQINESIIQYNELNSDKIIFCEGYKALDNPFFPKNAFKLTKGETLTIKAENLNINKIVNKGVFIVPLGNNTYKVGATYEWNTIDENSTKKGLEDLKGKLKKLLKAPFEVVKHEAGIRPTTIDRRPVLGNHPEHKNISFFNGFGTKAVMLTPYWALQVTENKLEENSYFQECDVQRFEVTTQTFTK